MGSVLTSMIEMLPFSSQAASMFGLRGEYFKLKIFSFSWTFLVDLRFSEVISEMLALSSFKVF